MKHYTAPPDGELPSDPRQFRILELFGWVTIAALVCAMVAPFVRNLSGRQLTTLGASVVFQLAVIVSTLIYLAGRRQEVLRNTGRRMGVGFLGRMRWQHGPLAMSVLGMLVLGVGQLAIAISLAIFDAMKNQPLAIPVYQVQFAVYTGSMISRFRWKLYPNAVEFFEHGVVFDGRRLIEPERIDLRASEMYRDRVVLVVRPKPNSVVGDTKVVQIPDELRHWLLGTGQHDNQ
ncbi:MAG: hypothetical protein R3E01_04295 [Pirellulaceae bacterium]|nr:hypothetical protein [Planctomycetales bacterium]